MLERKESAWVGGSILASLATFKNMWVSRSDYEEQGARILHRSSFVMLIDGEEYQSQTA